MAEDALGYLHQGDYHFVDEEYKEAIDSYNQGIESLNAHTEDLNHTRFRLLSHRSESHLKLCSSSKTSNPKAAAAAASALKDAQEAYDLLSKFEKLKLRIAKNEQDYCSKRLQRAAALSKKETQSGEGFSATSDQSKEIVKANISNISNKKPPAMPKYQYYQNEKFVTIAILECNVQPQSLDVKFSPKKLAVILTKAGKNFTVICGPLYDSVIVDKCQIKYKDEKVLIKLKKKDEKVHWHELFGVANEDDEVEEEKTGTSGSVSAEVASGTNVTSEKDQSTTPEKKVIPTLPPEKTRPYASHRDWDAIERDLKKDEKKEKPQGEDALNHLFKDIYGKANEDTRRAMIKSFQTSGGTVLSTNWDEVSNKDYEKERQAPKGMQWKNWEGDKLDQKEHDEIGKD